MTIFIYLILLILNVEILSTLKFSFNFKYDTLKNKLTLIPVPKCDWPPGATNVNAFFFYQKIVGLTIRAEFY